MGSLGRRTVQPLPGIISPTATTTIRHAAPRITSFSVRTTAVRRARPAVLSPILLTSIVPARIGRRNATVVLAHLPPSALAVRRARPAILPLVPLAHSVSARTGRRNATVVLTHLPPSALAVRRTRPAVLPLVPLAHSVSARIARGGTFCAHSRLSEYFFTVLSALAVIVIEAPAELFIISALNYATASKFTLAGLRTLLDTNSLLSALRGDHADQTGDTSLGIRTLFSRLLSGLWLTDLSSSSHIFALEPGLAGDGTTAGVGARTGTPQQGFIASLP